MLLMAAERFAMKSFLASLLLVCSVWLSPAEGQEDAKASVGQNNVKEESLKSAPDFRLPDLNDQQASSADLKGSVIVLDFWGTWCEPCIAEIPTFNKLHEKYRSRGLKMIGITVQSGWAEDIKPYVDKYKIKYPVLVGNDDIVEQYEVIAFPTTYLIGKDFKVYKKYTGALPDKEAELERDIEKLLASR
jgi:peroxiredoxin